MHLPEIAPILPAARTLCVCVCVCVRARAHVIMTKCGPGAIVFLSLDRFVSVQWDQN